MQSSTAIAFRALVMLIVLISVPLFAIFGKNLPEVVKGLIEGRGLVLGPAPGAPDHPEIAVRTPSGPAPLQPGPYRAAGDSALIANSSAMPSAPAQGSPNSNPVAGGVPQTGGRVASTTTTAPWLSPPSGPRGVGANGQPGGAQPAGFQTPVDATPLAAPKSAPADQFTRSADQFTSSPANDRAASNPPRSAIPAGAPGPAPAERSAAATSPPATSMMPEAAISTGTGGIAAAPYPAVGDEKFRLAELRLRSLGATHYLLETWGPDNSRYRFACKMAGNSGVNHLFQAIEDDPWLAMNSVLHQVEDWRSQSQQ